MSQIKVCILTRVFAQIEDFREAGEPVESELLGSEGRSNFCIAYGFEDSPISFRISLPDEDDFPEAEEIDDYIGRISEYSILVFQTHCVSTAGDPRYREFLNPKFEKFISALAPDSWLIATHPGGGRYYKEDVVTEFPLLESFQVSEYRSTLITEMVKLLGYCLASTSTEQFDTYIRELIQLIDGTSSLSDENQPELSILIHDSHGPFTSARFRYQIASEAHLKGDESGFEKEYKIASDNLERAIHKVVGIVPQYFVSAHNLLKEGIPINKTTCKESKTNEIINTWLKEFRQRLKVVDTERGNE